MERETDVIMCLARLIGPTILFDLSATPLQTSQLPHYHSRVLAKRESHLLLKKKSLLHEKKNSKFLPIEPPPVMKMPGRPKTKRIRSQNEPRKASSDYKLSRKGQRISCAKCHQVGHNKKSCTQVCALSLLILLSFYTCISELVVGINDFL